MFIINMCLASCTTKVSLIRNSDLLGRVHRVQPLPPRTADIIDHMSSPCCKHKQSDGDCYLQVTTVPKLLVCHALEDSASQNGRIEDR